MPESFEEAWEFYSPDPEIAELFVEERAKEVRGTSDYRKLVLSFAGNRHMDCGVFDGVTLGGGYVGSWFRWGESSGNARELFSELETVLGEISRENRAEWLIERVGAAWANLTPQRRSVMVALAAWAPRPRDLRCVGRKPGPRADVAAVLGVSPVTVYRSFLSTKFAIINDLVGTSYCACGCGGKVAIAYTSNKKYGHRVGQAVKFITGHNSGPNQIAARTRAEAIAHAEKEAELQRLYDKWRHECRW